MLTKYGRMRERYLREHKRVLYFNLLTSGKLYEHLAEIDTSACNMAKYLIKEMARKQGVTEQLKAEDMMKWVGLMNNIGACVDEIVLNDIVYVRFTPDGKIRPLAINYDKTRTYGIDRVLAVKHGTSRFGVKGHCFTCLICGQKRNLWLEKGKWFVEAYCATSEGRAS